MQRSFDYRAKNLVRDRWFGFLPERLPTLAPVLYLPGHENLELPGYLARGAKPQQLFGAERDETRYRAAKRIVGGANLFHGSVGAFVPWFKRRARKVKLFAANLDFEGSVLTVTDEVAAVFEIFPDREGYLGLTSFASRDPQTYIDGLVALSIAKSVLPAGFMEQVGRIFRQGNAYCTTMDSAANPEYFLTREFSLIKTLVVAIGRTSSSADAFASANFERLIAPMRREIQRAVRRYQRQRPSLHFTTDTTVAALFDRARTTLWPTTLERYVYHTMNHNRMQVWYVRFVRAAQSVPMRALVEQFVELTSRMPMAQFDSIGNEIIIRTTS